MSDLNAIDDCFSQVGIILCSPQFDGNLGAVARAMKTMGITQMHLVTPRASGQSIEAKKMALSAQDVLFDSQIHQTLEDALSTYHTSVAFTARARDIATVPHEITTITDTIAEMLWVQSQNLNAFRVALVFGNEQHGLSNSELVLCSHSAYISTSRAYPSLNLAACVQVACYQFRVAMQKQMQIAPLDKHTKMRFLATHLEVENLVDFLMQQAELCGYWDSKKPGQMRERFRRLFLSSSLEREEIDLWRGYIKALQIHNQSKV